MLFRSKKKIVDKTKIVRKLPTVSAAIAGQILNGLVQLGLSATELMEKTSLNPDALEDPEARIPINIPQKLILLGIELTKDPAIALKVGETTRLEQTGIVGYLLQNSPRLKDAILLGNRFHKLVNNSDNWQCTTENDYIRIIYDVAETEFYDIYRLEVAFSSALTVFRQLIGTNICPAKIYLNFSAPAYTSEYERIFQCQLEFGSNQNSFLFRSDSLDIELPNKHDPYLEKVLTKHANQLLSKVETLHSFQDKIRKLIIENISSGSLNIEWIADQAKMSRWTLNRRLNEEGATFKKIHTQVKEQLAYSYLENPNLSIIEISFLLGYSDITAFQKAFKKWSGASPFQYRKTKENRELYHAV